MKRSQNILLFSAIAFVLLLLMVVVTSKTHTPVATPSPTVSATPKVNPPTKEELLKLVNAEREKAGVAPLIIDDRLNASAQRKSDDMVLYNYFGHISPHDNKHGYEYINDVGIYCKTDGENLVWKHGESLLSASEAVDSWMHSQIHHDAMLNASYSLTGFGINKDRITEHFCEQ